MTVSIRPVQPGFAGEVTGVDCARPLSDADVAAINAGMDEQPGQLPIRRLRGGDEQGHCLSLLSNAVLVWNTVHIARIVDQLRAAGHEVKDEDLARVSPLAHAHVIPNGSYFQSPRRRAEAAPEPAMA